MVAGTLKRPTHDSGSDHPIAFDLLDEKEAVLSSGRFADPRFASMEVFNEDGSISRVTRNLPSAVAVIRMPYHPGAAAVRFAEPAMAGEKARVTLGTVPLDLQPPADDE